MLSRSAQGLYWMGRYLERAEHLCRLLRLETEALVDRPPREIYFGWSRIYGSINRLPPGGTLEIGDDLFTLVDSYTLADDLTFEHSNPDSVWSCFALGRENARQMRHCISAEMWTRLNLAYLRVQKLSIQEIWDSPESFYEETVTEVATFAGVAAATMYRDEGWSFLQIGRFIERVQLSTSLLLAHLAAETASTGESESESESDWTSLLRACHAFDAYNRRYSVEVRPRQVMDLLATDSMLPGSLCRSLDMVAAELDALGPGPDARSSADVMRLAGRMAALIRYDWPDQEDYAEILRQVRGHGRELHHLVASAYFDYPVEDFRAR
jgi:uncharacterized alpha-E superfamily protein